MTDEEAIAAIRERATFDPEVMLRALDILLDDTVPGLREVVAMQEREDTGEFRRGFDQAYAWAADHIEEALFEAFGIHPGEEASGS